MEQDRLTKSVYKSALENRRGRGHLRRVGEGVVRRLCTEQACASTLDWSTDKWILWLEMLLECEGDKKGFK